MKAFLRKLIFWICSGLLFAACIEWLAGNEQNDYTRKYEVLKHAEADTLILGSSHSFYGVTANGLDRGDSYNMSWSSQTLDETFWVANEAPSQTHLFICISPFTLASTVNNRVELWRNAYFNRTFHWISSNRFCFFCRLSLERSFSFRPQKSPAEAGLFVVVNCGEALTSCRPCRRHRQQQQRQQPLRQDPPRRRSRTRWSGPYR